MQLVTLRIGGISFMKFDYNFLYHSVGALQAETKTLHGVGKAHLDPTVLHFTVTSCYQ